VSDRHTTLVAEVVSLLVEARKKSGLSQQTVASRAGLSRAGIGHMEKGRTNPTLLSLLKISEVLGVDLAKYIGKAGLHARD
jgi:transcriptional regulator with XRE-family HTH domain